LPFLPVLQKNYIGQNFLVDLCFAEIAKTISFFSNNHLICFFSNLSVTGF
jgi:hypothetical protein